jgi:hypothetical protein
LSKAGIHVRLVKRSGWLIGAKICLALLTLVFAASITANSTTYQAEVGSSVSVTNQLQATDKGFSAATSTLTGNGTSSSSPVIFNAIPGFANTNITAGHLLYDVQVNSTSLTGGDKNFTVTFYLASTPYGPLYLQSPASPVAGQTINCRFDIGTGPLPSTPYSFRVIVE